MSGPYCNYDQIGDDLKFLGEKWRSCGATPRCRT